MSPGSCSVEGCENKVFARGWCVAHYRRWQRHGDPRPDRPVRDRSPLDVDRVIGLYEAGATCRGIGTAIGVSADVIRRALRAHGVQLPTRLASKPLRSPIRPITTNTTNEQNSTKQHDSTDQPSQNSTTTTTTKPPSTPRHPDPEGAAVADAERTPPPC